MLPPRPASLVVVPTKTRLRKRVKPSQGQYGLIRVLVCLAFDIIGGTILMTKNFVNSDALLRHLQVNNGSLGIRDYH